MSVTNAPQLDAVLGVMTHALQAAGADASQAAHVADVELVLTHDITKLVTSVELQAPV